MNTKVLDELKKCLHYEYGNGTGGHLSHIIPELYSKNFGGDFRRWLLRSGYYKLSSLLKIEHRGSQFSLSNRELEKIEYECLQSILDVLMEHTHADFFYYVNTTTMSMSKLNWIEPNQKIGRSDSLRVNEQKIKLFLRELKLNNILNEN